jgi:hypothetical protein
MKKVILFICLFLSLSWIACDNSNTNRNAEDKQPPGNKTAVATNTNSEPVTKSPGGKGITGQWTLRLECYDDNENHKPDPEEMQKGWGNKYFYQFNEDGSCLIHSLKMKGHYEIKEVNGKQKLLVYRDEYEDPGLEAQYEIVSMSDNELVLLWEITFWIFKRV